MNTFLKDSNILLNWLLRLGRNASPLPPQQTNCKELSQVSRSQLIFTLDVYFSFLLNIRSGLLSYSLSFFFFHYLQWNSLLCSF